MKLSVISFTENGLRLSQSLAAAWENARGGNEIEALALYTKYGGLKSEETPYPVRDTGQSVGEWAKEQMEERNGLLFIGACGIAVRAIAPSLTDKLSDSPVLVMDEKGRYVIPILSGHVGGANGLAVFVSGLLGAEAVITTATDLNGRFAVDLFAKRNALTIEGKEGIAKISSRVLAGETIALSIEPGRIRGKLPEGLFLTPYPPKGHADILICAEKGEFDADILLRPRDYVIGMGCKRGTPPEKIEALIRRVMEETGIETGRIMALASLDRKRDEEGFLAWSRKYRRPFLTYTPQELMCAAGEFQASDFVREKTGADNVCERAAIRACGERGRIVYGKYAQDGMTIAVAKREWSVTFDEK